MSDAFESILAGIDKWTKESRDRAYDMMTDLELEAISVQKEALLGATTTWGWARQQGLVAGPAGPSRPHAGRYEEGYMYENITGETDWVDKDTIETRWGWQDSDLRDYFMDQEHGKGKIPAANSLATSMFWIEDELAGRLKDL